MVVVRLYKYFVSISWLVLAYKYLGLGTRPILLGTTTACQLEFKNVKSLGLGLGKAFWWGLDNTNTW